LQYKFTFPNEIHKYSSTYELTSINEIWTRDELAGEDTRP